MPHPIRHLIPAETLERLKDIDQNPMSFHKTRFVKHLEHKADDLMEEYTSQGLSHDEALSKVAADLHDLTQEWKAVARARKRR